MNGRERKKGGNGKIEKTMRQEGKMERWRKKGLSVGGDAAFSMVSVKY